MEPLLTAAGEILATVLVTAVLLVYLIRFLISSR